MQRVTRRKQTHQKLIKSENTVNSPSMGTVRMHWEEPHKALSMLYSSARCLLPSIICSGTIVIMDLNIRVVS